MNSTERLLLDTIADATPLFRVIARSHRNLAQQAERALHSVALQYAEGEHARGGNRDAKLHGAYAEAKEAATALRIACGAISSKRAERTFRQLDHIAAILYLKRTRRI